MSHQEFSLPNVGPGPDPLSISALVAAAEEPLDAVVLLLQRDHLCGNCRRQVQAVADRYPEFRERHAEVVSIVPESRERVATWQESYQLPYPLCADPSTAAGEAFDQPVRLGPLGRLSDLLGRMPAAIVLDVRDPEAVAVAYAHRGRSTWDRPEIDELLAAIAALE